MQERLRHQYLEALGIPSWLPRAPLPGARPSADWVWGFRHGEVPVEDDGFFDDASYDRTPEDATAAVAPVAPGAATGGTGRAALLDSLGAETEGRRPAAHPVQPAAIAPAAAAPAAEEATAVGEPLPPLVPQEIPEFKLAFLRLGDALLIDSLPPQSRGGLTPAHQRLSTALARALGVMAEQPPLAQMLPWPAFTSRSLDQGWEQAEAAVQRKLERLLEGNRPRFLLLLGGAATQLVLRTRESAESLRGEVCHPRPELPALATASLSEMLQVPGCKREVWRDLQPLIRQLAND